MTELSPNAELVRCLLTGVPVIGVAPDMGSLSDMELGALARFAWGPGRHGMHAQTLGAVLRDRAPMFSGEAAVAALSALADSAAEDAQPSKPAVTQWMVSAAAQVVSGCDDASEPSVQVALRALFEQGIEHESGLVDVAMLSCAGLPAQERKEHQGDLERAEQAFLCSLESPRDRVLMGRVRTTWQQAVDDDELTPRGADPLALLPGYLAFAETLTARALEHTRAIQAGSVPYAADKAFAGDDAYAIHAALRAGLDQGAPWAAEAAIPLLAGLTIAPLDKAKTAPSQSAAIAVAKAICERPSARLVTDMKATVARVRHAGLVKKLARFLDVAKRRLFEHDDFLIELDPGEPIPKALSATVTRALEALFLRSAPLPLDLWMSRILGNPAAADRVARLVWQSSEGPAFVPVREGKRWVFHGPDGAPHSLREGSVTLWHPLQPGANASAWRAWLLSKQVEQPFNQLFRETYSPASIPSFMAPELDVKTLLGLARSQGWVLRHERLLRKLGPYRVELNVGRVFPGAEGATRCFGIDLVRAADGELVEVAAEPVQAVSECLRAVDLLVSVAAFALDPANAREGASARERRAALVGMLGETSDAGRPFVDGHHVRAGNLAISIATGLAMRDGAEVEAPPATKGVAVIPYPDEILRRIVLALNEYGIG